MMRIEDMKAFVTLADIGTYHAAAEILCITQPALTRRIQKLEELLGVRLLERSTRRLRLTGAGYDFLDKARRIVIDTDNAIAELRAAGSQRHGQVRIACLPSVGLRLLPEVLPEYQRTHPRVALRIVDVNAIQIFEMVDNGEVDFGLGMHLNDIPDVSCEPLYTEPLGIVCNENHTLARREDLQWSDLAGFPLVFNIDQSGNWLLVQRELSGVENRLNWFHQTQSLMGGLILVRRGDAVAVMPHSITDTLGLKGIVFRAVTGPDIRRQTVIVQRPTSMRSSYAQTLLDLCRTHGLKLGADQSSPLVPTASVR
jgi:DNA-binding transcriptional LysR family regulator